MVASGTVRDFPIDVIEHLRHNELLGAQKGIDPDAEVFTLADWMASRPS